MVVEAEVVDRDRERHLVQLGDGRLAQSEFDGEAMYRVGEVVSLDTDKDILEWIS